MNEQDIRKTENTQQSSGANSDPFGRPERQRPMTSYERDRAAREIAARSAQETTPRSSTTASRASRSSGSSRASSAGKSSSTAPSKSVRAVKFARSKKKGGFAALLFFPVLFVWLELVLHIFMKMDLKYFPIYLMHGIMYGCIFNFITFIWPKKISLIVGKVLAILVSLIFCIEFVAKNILQDFYPASMIKTAAGNNLTDYIGAIVQEVLAKCYVIILLLAPAILTAIFIKEIPKIRMKKRGILIVSVFAAIVFYLVGMFFIILPWKGNVSPKELYYTDTGYDDQVEQLGLTNFIRLDFKHMIWPVQHEIKPIDPDSGDNPLGPGGEDQPVDPAVDTSPNIIGLDWDAMAKAASNANHKNLISYFRNVTPTKKNQYTGIFEGYNVVFLTVEGLSGYAVTPEWTPTLWKLSHEGFVFNNFYSALHFTSTSNGECQNLLGLYPKNGFPITMSRTGELKTNAYFSLAQQLNRLGYASWGYHNNGDMYNRAASHSNLGYNWRYIHYNGSYQKYKDCMDYEGNKGENSGKLRWPQRDTYMAQHTVGDYVNGSKPFNVYYMTITGHMPYTLGSWAFNEWRDTVNQLKYQDKTKAYIASVMECDKAVKILIDEIEAAGKLDKTVFVIAPDHIPYFDVDTLEEISGMKFGDSKDFEAINETNINFDVYHSYLAIWSPSIADKKIDINKVCCQVDILPTVSNLLGLEYDSRMLAGSDILSTSEGMVIFSSRSWRTNVGTYNAKTKKFTPAEGVKLTQSAQDAYIKYMNNVAANKLSITPMIVESNFYNFALASGKYRSSSEGSSGTVKSIEELIKDFKGDLTRRVLPEYKAPAKFVPAPKKSILEQ